MSNEVSISVIMSVHNQFNKEELLCAVNSILNQTHKNIEFLICDDGSDEKAAKLIGELNQLDKRIRILTNVKNQGLAASLNTCIVNAKGKYVARMDADDYSAPKRLETEFAFLENNPQYAWCGCNARLYDDEGIWGERIMPLEPQVEDYLKYSPYIHPTVMFRKYILLSINGYDASKETRRCEDYELFMRLTSKGYVGFNIPKFMFAYKEDSDSYKKRTFKSRINEAKVRRKNFKRLGIPFTKRFIYTMRPLVAGLLTNKFISRCKRKESGYEGDDNGANRILREDFSKSWIS